LLPDPHDFAIVTNNFLNFDIPTYSERDCKRYEPPAGEYIHLLNNGVPDVVRDTILRILPRSVPVSPMIVYGYLANGSLPPFLINYFMSALSPVGRVSQVGRFYRALHLIETVRADFFSHYEEEETEEAPVKKPVDTLKEYYDKCSASLDAMESSGNIDEGLIDRDGMRLQMIREALDRVSGPSDDEEADLHRQQIAGLQSRMKRLLRKSKKQTESEPSKSTTAEPPKSTTAEPSKSTSTEPSKSTSAKPSKSTFTETAKATPAESEPAKSATEPTKPTAAAASEPSKPTTSEVTEGDRPTPPTTSTSTSSTDSSGVVTVTPLASSDARLEDDDRGEERLGDDDDDDDDEPLIVDPDN